MKLILYLLKPLSLLLFFYCSFAICSVPKKPSPSPLAITENRRSSLDLLTSIEGTELSSSTSLSGSVESKPEQYASWSTVLSPKPLSSDITPSYLQTVARWGMQKFKKFTGDENFIIEMCNNDEVVLLLEQLQTEKFIGVNTSAELLLLAEKFPTILHQIHKRQQDIFNLLLDKICFSLKKGVYDRETIVFIQNKIINPLKKRKVLVLIPPAGFAFIEVYRKIQKKLHKEDEPLVTKKKKLS